MDWTMKLAAGLLAILLLLALSPTPLDPREQVDPVVGRNRPPGTRLLEVRLRDGKRLLADHIESSDQQLILITPDRSRTVDLGEVTNWGLDGIENSRLYLLGSDKLGRDVLSRLIVGARVSLTIGILAGTLAITLGILVGTLAAIGGPRIDNILMRGVDGILAFPAFFLVLALAAILQPSLGQVILLLGGTSWMSSSRLARAEILSLKQRDFVMASHSLGQRPLRIVTLHLIPNALTPLIVQATLMVGDLILTETALSFFGLGVQVSTPSWGSMILDGQNSMGTAWWVALFPGIAISLTVIAFNLLGDGLRDRLDPQRTRPFGGHAFSSGPRPH